MDTDVRCCRHEKAQKAQNLSDPKTAVQLRMDTDIEGVVAANRRKKRKT
jgi:hypothetical protein